MATLLIDSTKNNNYELWSICCDQNGWTLLNFVEGSKFGMAINEGIVEVWTERFRGRRKIVVVDVRSGGPSTATSVWLLSKSINVSRTTEESALMELCLK
jgi:hypothetical protein